MELFQVPNYIALLLEFNFNRYFTKTSIICLKTFSSNFNVEI
jgi:hypothetical protein